jgi:metal-sulfur cluster biosynthetic enzyme
VSNILDPEISRALGCVFDPCSIGANTPLSVIDMGLVLGWSVEGSHLDVRLCVTSPCCTMAPNIARAAESALLLVPGIETVEVTIDPAMRWTPARMSEEGRSRLAHRREASIHRDDLKPQQWRTARGRARDGGSRP